MIDEYLARKELEDTIRYEVNCLLWILEFSSSKSGVLAGCSAYNPMLVETIFQGYQRGQVWCNVNS